MRPRKILASAAIAVAVSAGASSASPVNPFVVEAFDGQGNLPSPYINQGFQYSTTFDNAGQCFNSRCLQVANGNGQDPNLDMDSSTGQISVLTRELGGSFDLLGFYLNFNGFGGGGNSGNNGNGGNNGNSGVLNFIRMSADTGQTMDITVATDESSKIQLFNADTLAEVNPAQLTQDSQGYFLLFRDDFFDDVESIMFVGSDSAQLRLDCVLTSTVGANANGVGSFNGCQAYAPPPPGGGGGGIAPIPLPAAGWLLLAGLGGLAAYGRRRKA